MAGQALGPGKYKKVTVDTGKMAVYTPAAPFDNLIKMLKPPRSIDLLTCAGFGS
jgi:hypothetical protein